MKVIAWRAGRGQANRELARDHIRPGNVRTTSYALGTRNFFGNPAEEPCRRAGAAGSGFAGDTERHLSLTTRPATNEPAWCS